MVHDFQFGTRDVLQRLGGSGGVLDAHIGLAMLNDAHCQRAELKFPEHLGKGMHVGWLASQLLLVPLHRHIGLDGGKELGELDLVDVLGHLALH